MANMFKDLFGAAKTAHNAPNSQADINELRQEMMYTSTNNPAIHNNAGTQISGTQLSGTQASGQQLLNVRYPSPITNIRFAIEKVRNGYTLDVDGEEYIAKDIAEVVVIITSQIAAMELKAASNK